MSDRPDHVWLCAWCIHIRRPINLAVPRCTAYPRGIPWEIQVGQVRHTKPYPGDHGIRFAPLPGERHPAEEDSP